MQTLISTSSALFTSTTGFSYADLVTWSGDVIKLVLGAGLGLVNSMLGWIIALAVVGVIIGLIYHALRFLHILR